MRTSYYRYYPKRRGNTCYTPCARANCPSARGRLPARNGGSMPPRRASSGVLAAVLEARKQRAANVILARDC